MHVVDGDLFDTDAEVIIDPWNREFSKVVERKCQGASSGVVLPRCAARLGPWSRGSALESSRWLSTRRDPP